MKQITPPALTGAKVLNTDTKSKTNLVLNIADWALKRFLKTSHELQNLPR